jgi:DNA-binding XRE family transcriptional regulator
VLANGLIPERQDLPGKIRAARLRMGLTQVMLAHRAELDVRTVRNTETGRHQPCRSTLARVGRVLRLEL